MKQLTNGIFSFFLLCLITNAQEGSPWISLNGNDVHPTRIVARLNNQRPDVVNQGGVQSTLNAAGSSVIQQSAGIPGLLVLDLPASSAAPRGAYRPTPNEKDQVEELLARIEVLKNSGHFQYVEPDYVWKVSQDAPDPAYTDGRLWGLKNTGQNGGEENADIDADLAWDVTTGSRMCWSPLLILEFDTLIRSLPAICGPILTRSLIMVSTMISMVGLMMSTVLTPF
jgi:hypothetical protein